MDRIWVRFLSFILCGALVGCASFKPDSTLPLSVVPSPNADERRPSLVVIHYTSNDDAAHSLKTLTSPERRVSAHYLISREGALYQMVPELRRAWHAGQAYWAGITDVNSASIGIELDNNGTEPYDEAQLATLQTLLQDQTVLWRKIFFAKRVICSLRAKMHTICSKKCLKLLQAIFQENQAKSC